MTFKIFGALKLVRVLRLSKIIAYLRATEEIKAFLKLIKLVFFLMIYMHCLACVWWMIVSRDEIWIATLYYNDVDLYFVYTQSNFYKYFASLHTSVMITTGNDVGPIGFIQTTISTVGLFFGAVINANIFGELAVLVS